MDLGLFKENPDLTVRKEENLSLNKALAMTKTAVESFFELYHEKLSTLNLTNRPDRIFNIHEIGFQMTTQPKDVLVPKGQKWCIAFHQKRKVKPLLL